MHSIAMHHGTTIGNLMALNPQIRNPHRMGIFAHPAEKVYQASGANSGVTSNCANSWMIAFMLIDSG